MTKEAWISSLLNQYNCPVSEKYQATRVLNEYWDMAKVLEAAKVFKNGQGDFMLGSIGAVAGGATTYALGANPFIVASGTIAGSLLSSQAGDQYYFKKISDSTISSSTTIQDLERELREGIHASTFLAILNRKLESVREKVGMKHKADIINGIGTAIGAFSGCYSIGNEYGEDKALVQVSQAEVGAIVGLAISRQVGLTLFSSSAERRAPAQNPSQAQVQTQSIRRRRSATRS